MHPDHPCAAETAHRSSALIRILAPALLLAIGLGLRLGLAWQDHRILLAEWVWSDDAYLALSVARHLALGDGMTSDGTNVTNGFQPLYVFLMVPVYWLLPDDLVLPVHVAGTILAFAGAAAGGMFYLIALRLFSRPAALCVLFFFSISHYFVATEVNGLETSLYGLTLAATLYYYVTRFVPARPVSGGQCAVLGVLAGLTFLARVDAAFLLVCVAGHFLWERRGELSRTVGGAAAGTLGFLLTAGPWLAASVILCRAILPPSGAAVRFLAVQNGWRAVSNLVGHTGPPLFTDDRVPWEYYCNNVLHLTTEVIAFLPITAHAQGFSEHASLPREAKHFPIGRAIARAPWLVLAAVAVVTVAALVAPPWLYRRGWLQRGAGLGAIAFLRFAIVGWLAFYAFYILCPWYSHRYLYPILALLTVASGAFLHAVFNAVRGLHRGVKYGLVGLAAAAYVLLFLTHTDRYYTAHRSPGLPDRYTSILPYIERHIPPEATIGSFQSGVMSYFLPNRMVNLDGVVNAEALRATHEHRLWNYILDQGVDYIVDWPVCITGLLTKFSGVDRLPLRHVHGQYGMHVYKVVDEADLSASPAAPIVGISKGTGPAR